MQDAKMVAQIRRKYRALRPEMDERMRRQWAAAEAKELGWGGVSLVANATGLSRPTISVRIEELELSPKKRLIAAQQIRRPGAGRKQAADLDPELIAALEQLKLGVCLLNPKTQEVSILVVLDRWLRHFVLV